MGADWRSPAEPNLSGSLFSVHRAELGSRVCRDVAPGHVAAASCAWPVWLVCWAP